METTPPNIVLPGDIITVACNLSVVFSLANRPILPCTIFSVLHFTAYNASREEFHGCWHFLSAPQLFLYLHFFSAFFFLTTPILFDEV